MKFFNLNANSETVKWQKTPDGFLRCHARILAERIMPYTREELGDLPDGIDLETINMLVTKDEMSREESLRTLEGAPIVAGDHIWLTPEIVNTYGMGSVAGTPKLDGDYLECDLLVTNPDAIKAIESGDIGEISAAYHADTIFESGEWQGKPYDAQQVGLRYNHIAIIPNGHGRAGRDVKIMNAIKNPQEEIPMAGKEGEDKMVKVRLKNTGAFVFVNEDGAVALEKEEETSGKNLEKTMNELEGKNSELATLQAEVDELKGELSVYKEKLDQLLSVEAVEHAAEEMVAETSEAEEIIENASFANEDGTEDEEKKKEVMNSLKGLHKEKLHTAVLNAIGIKTDDMSADGKRGAFKAQFQIANSTKGKRTIAGQKIANSFHQTEIDVKQPEQKRSPLERLGFPSKK